jgi:ABC-type branched-subunit amino acid transport system substrate-binding protein
MGARRYRVGVMFSSTGSYQVVARSMLNGALLGFAHAADPAVELDPVVVDPGGDLRRYLELSHELLGSGIRHVVGCYTSSSRKEVIPCFEKHDALLWYPSHYEGFESSSNVIYTGAAPNQHILPLIDHLLASFGSRAFCVGSNYIWAWENNRILRETVTARGGSVLAERYVAVGETELDKLVEAVIAARPSFVFNTLIGTSSYAFLRLFRAACRARGIDQAREIPVASCTLSEPELEEIGRGAVEGHISCSVYFSTVGSPANAAFLRDYGRAFPEGPTTSADAEASYIAVRLLALALAEAGTDEVSAVQAAVTRQRLGAPQGEVWIDPETLHAYLTPRIGRSTTDARFAIIKEAPAPVRPDPYLVQSSPRFALPVRPANLRVVQ